MVVDQLSVPIDPLVKMPHPLLIYDVSSTERWNYDHMFFPANDPLLQGLGGVAVRRCYGQLIPVRIHKEKNTWFNAVDLPQTEDEQFRTVVKGLAGVVSRWAIDMRLVAKDAEDPLVYMDDEVFARTANRFSVYHEHAWHARGDKRVRREVGSFMMDYVLRTDIQQAVSSKVVKEFLGSKERLRRHELGNFIIKEAMNAQLDTIALEIVELRRLGMVPKGRTDIWELPRKIIPRAKKRDYHNQLIAQLEAA